MIIKEGRYLEGSILAPIEIDESRIEHASISYSCNNLSDVSIYMDKRGYYYSFSNFHCSGVPTAVVDTDTMDYIEGEITKWGKEKRNG